MDVDKHAKRSGRPLPRSRCSRLATTKGRRGYDPPINQAPHGASTVRRHVQRKVLHRIMWRSRAQVADYRGPQPHRASTRTPEVGGTGHGRRRCWRAGPLRKSRRRGKPRSRQHLFYSTSGAYRDRKRAEGKSSPAAPGNVTVPGSPRVGRQWTSGAWSLKQPSCGLEHRRSAEARC